MAKDRFVPQFYLRQFARTDAPRLINVVRIHPFHFFSEAQIKGQCQENSFYENNDKLNEFILENESKLAPILKRVIASRRIHGQADVDYLQYLAVSLHMRTRKAAELAKLVPRKEIVEALRHAIRLGKIPAPTDPSDLEKWDFKGVPGFLIGQSLPCIMEMRTMGCKLLAAPPNAAFISSDNPVALLNQFCAHIQDQTGVTGFSKAGLQLALPLSPNLCLFSYDAHVYKVGNRHDRTAEITASDVDLINSLQLQCCDDCLYFHDPAAEPYVRRLIDRYGSLRRPIEDSVREYRNEKKVLIHQRHPAARLARNWQFCRYVRHIKVNPGDRRDPVATYLIEQMMRDIAQQPGKEDIMQRLDRIVARHSDK